MRYVLLILIAFSGFLGAAEDWNRAHVRPEAVIPLMLKTPVIDGRIEPGEWPTLRVGRFVSQGNDQLCTLPGEFWIGCDGTNLLIAVRSGVHPQLGVIAKRPADPLRDDSETVFDDSLELWFDNAPGQAARGACFQLLINSKGALMDARFTRPDKVADKSWRTQGLRQAHQVADGFWTAEFAIPLTALDIADPRKAFAMRVCRNFKNPWNQARWEPGVIGFDAPETMALVRFSEQAPVLSELPVQDAQGVRIGLELLNPGQAPLPLVVWLGHNAQDQPRYGEETKLTLAPGERKTVEYRKPFFAPSGFNALGEWLVKSGDGKEILYHRDAKWATAETAPGWDAVAAKSAEEAAELLISWLPSTGTLRWQAGFATYAKRDVVKEVRLQVRRKGAADVLAKGSATVGGDFSALGTLALPNIGEGDFEALLFLDGDKPATSRRFRHSLKFPWLGAKIGASDIIVPPFTPLAAKGGTLSCVGRELELGDCGLLKGIRSLGKELLAAPMRLQTPDGKLIGQGVTTVQRATPTHIEAESTWTLGALKGKSRMQLEQDGVCQIDLELAAGTGELPGLELLIPLKDAEAPLFHAACEGLRSNPAGRLPAGQGVLWTSAKLSRERILGSFCPYLFVGGVERGLCWFAGSDDGWVVDDAPGAPPAVSLERKDGAMLMRVRLAQKAFALDKVRRIRFGLQATPAKPMPANPDWRLTGYNSNASVPYAVLGMCMYWGADLYGAVPRGSDYKIIDQISAANRGQGDEGFFNSYVAANPDIEAEIRNASRLRGNAAWIPYTNPRGETGEFPEWTVFQDEWSRKPFRDGRSEQPARGCVTDGELLFPPSRLDYLVHAYRELQRHGVGGIYWDNVCLFSNENPGTTVGDGRRAESDVWGLRELIRRTAGMAEEERKPMALISHMTNAAIIPALCWGNAQLDWEWHYGSTDFQERFSRDYILTTSLGLQAGVRPVALGGILNAKDAAQQRWIERTRIAATFPHEIDVWQADELWTKLRQRLYELGYGRDAKVFHWYDDEPLAHVEGLDAITLVVAGPKEIAVLVADWGTGGSGTRTSGTVTLDLKRLGLGANAQAVDWEDASRSATVMDGRLPVVDLRQHDFRLYLIRREP